VTAGNFFQLYSNPLHRPTNISQNSEDGTIKLKINKEGW